MWEQEEAGLHRTPSAMIMPLQRCSSPDPQFARPQELSLPGLLWQPCFTWISWEQLFYFTKQLWLIYVSLSFYGFMTLTQRNRGLVWYKTLRSRHIWCDKHGVAKARAQAGSAGNKLNISSRNTDLELSKSGFRVTHSISYLSLK